MKEKTTFKRLLRTPQPEKKEAPRVGKASATIETMAPSGKPSSEETEAGEVKKQPEIYTDVSVCKMLHVRRRVLAEARKEVTRGRDWDAIGEEVGMTRAWIYAYALEHGIVPDFFGEQLKPVKGRYVSVRLIGTTPNRCLVQVEIEATKKREFARTRNIMEYPIHYMEVFSCIRIDMPTDPHLEWIAAPNEAKY